MSAKALTYAEEVLGVHKVWEKVQSLLEDLDTTLADLDKAQDRKRELNDQYADREVELIGEMRGVHPNHSDTKFNAEMKVWTREDADLTRIRRELVTVLSEVQGREYDADLVRLRIKAGSARMEELGGYLHYLAAVKAAGTKNQAEHTLKPTQKTGAA